MFHLSQNCRIVICAVTQICVTLWGHGQLLALWRHAGEFIALVMKQLIFAAVTKMCVTLWGHGHFACIMGGSIIASVLKELFAAAVAHNYLGNIVRT